MLDALIRIVKKLNQQKDLTHGDIGALLFFLIHSAPGDFLGVLPGVHFSESKKTSSDVDTSDRDIVGFLGPESEEFKVLKL